MSAIAKKTSEHHTNGQPNDFERCVNNGSQNQVIEKSIDDKIRKAVDKAALVVKNCMHDAKMTAMDEVVKPKVETAVRSITGSTGCRPIGDVENPDRSDFSGNAGKTPLMSASSQFDLYTNQDRNDETGKEEAFENGDFSALRHSHDRRPPSHHNLYETKIVKTL